MRGFALSREDLLRRAVIMGIMCQGKSGDNGCKGKNSCKGKGGCGSMDQPKG